MYNKNMKLSFKAIKFEKWSLTNYVNDNKL